MNIKDNKNNYQQLRKQYSFFEYQSYSYNLNNGNLEMNFRFSLSDRTFFNPKLSIPANKLYDYEALDFDDIGNFVFHIGMIELISYWKAACPKKVIIRPHSLDNYQVQWWKKLYFHGLGEFFYLNNIDPDFDSFMEIHSHGEKPTISKMELSDSEVLVPIGGGKDSIVTLELLKKSNVSVVPLIINPREASIRTINIAGYSEKDSVIIRRSIDPELLELNKKGFLNGHTPFSAMLAFVSVLSSFITGVANIALSNESSANESTVPGTKINHQYSKSFEFETDFNNYIKKYLHGGIHYFSFLRPINELQIAKLFSGFEKHFNSFRSCNVGSKNDSWCGNCPKCMFTYIILNPFIDSKRLVEIFGKDIIADISLSEIMNELTGKSEVKPFECVGTIDEVVAALAKYKDVDHNLISNDVEGANRNFISLLMSYNTDNLVPDIFNNILKKAINV